MESITASDREILRSVAHRKLELANSPRNDEILRQWEALGRGERARPTVRLLFSNFVREVVMPRMRCQGEAARSLEAELLSSMVGRELFDDDTPLSPTFEVVQRQYADIFKTHPNLTYSKTSIGFHIEPVTDDIEQDIDLFGPGGFVIDTEGTRRHAALADEIFGDILPSRVVMANLTGSLTNAFVQLIGMETMYVSMLTAPDAFHRIMESTSDVYLRFFDALEQQKALLPTCGISPLQQESFAFNHELPTDHADTTRDVWGFLECQEMTAASPKMFGEFVYPYMDKAAQRFGLLSYGCCERVDTLFEDYLSRWKHLRKLSVSPFNDTRRVGDYLRGTEITYYFKPRAEHVTNPGPLDEKLITDYFKNAAKEASGCLFEVAQREVGTIYGDYERGRRYVELARNAIDSAYQA